MSHDVLEQILRASDADNIETNCPQDLRVVGIVQDAVSCEQRKFTVIVTSEELNVEPAESWAEVPVLEPFTYTVVEPPPPTQETSDG